MLFSKVESANAPVTEQGSRKLQVSRKQVVISLAWHP